MLQGQPFVFFCRMVVAHLQRVEVAQGQLHLGHSCGESYHVWHGKGFSKEHGDERGLIFWGLQCGAYGGSYGIEASSDTSLSRQKSSCTWKLNVPCYERNYQKYLFPRI